MAQKNLLAKNFAVIYKIIYFTVQIHRRVNIQVYQVIRSLRLKNHDDSLIQYITLIVCK